MYLTFISLQKMKRTTVLMPNLVLAARSFESQYSRDKCLVSGKMVYSRAGSLRRWGTLVLTSRAGRSFYKEGNLVEKTILMLKLPFAWTKRPWGGGLKSPLGNGPIQSILIRTSKLVKQWSGVRHPVFHHPGFMVEVRKSLGARMPEGQNLSFEVRS